MKIKGFYEDGKFLINSIDMFIDTLGEGDDPETSFIVEGSEFNYPESRDGYNIAVGFDPINKEITYTYVEIMKSPEQIAQEKLDIIFSKLEPYDYILNDTRRVNNMTLEEVLNVKISQLKEACTQAIYSGFESEMVGESFGFNDHDQMNFTQQLLLIISSNGSYNRDIMWKTLNGDIVKMSTDQFMSLIREAEQHKLDCQLKYWEIEKQIKEASTREEIISIKW